jgi:hypothetical protein
MEFLPHVRELHGLGKGELVARRITYLALATAGLRGLRRKSSMK